MTVDVQQPRPSAPPPIAAALPHVIIYGHSWLFYWWPLWVVGYIMSLIIWLHPVRVDINEKTELFSADRNLGVIYTLLFLLMIAVTSSNVRGMAAAFVILGLAFVSLLFAYLDWWPVILGGLGDLNVFMNLGFYLSFSTGLFVIWLLTFLVFDHISFWRIRPGQVTHEYLLGIVDKSYDTETMEFSKDQSDLFRNWVLGFGSGDFRMATMGGRGVQSTVQNVLFVNFKIAEIERLIATKPVTEGK